MPVDLETLYKRILIEVVTVSQGIRNSALQYANAQNFNVSEKLRRQLEVIRLSADAILEAFTKASLTSYTLDDRIIDWITSGEPRLCLDKLKEMETMLIPAGQGRPTQVPVPSLRQVEDKLSTALVFFDTHKGLFHFLLSSEVWNHESLVCRSSRSSPLDTLQVHPVEETEHDLQQCQIESAAVTGCDTEEEYYTAPEYSTASENERGENNSLPDTARAGEIRETKDYKRKLEEALRWLAALDCVQKHNDTLKLHQQGTCTWFPSTDAYEKWRVGRTQLLWLHGKGCGKSVLLASTIEHLKNTLQHDEVVAYFYCDFRSERSTRPAELMRSILSQLLQCMITRNVDPGDLPARILEQKRDGTLSLNDLDKLGDLVSHAARCFRYHPILVIDALDECADVEALLQAIVELDQSDVRVLVTSRPDQSIMDHLRDFRSLSFESVAKELAGDIALLVQREISSHPWPRSIEPEVRNEMYTKVNEKAEGRFRWVQCQFDILKRCGSVQALREALDNLPNRLETTYERILGEIDERKSDGRLARHALTWLVVAMEPLHLTQIIDGFSVYLQQPRINCETLGTMLLHALSSLVSYYEETDVLALSHYSVKEYLTRSAALSMYRVVSHDAHAEVVQICMRYISFVLKEEPSRGRVAPLQSFPTLSYILSRGFDHLALVNPNSTLVLEALQSLGSDIRRHPSHWELLCELREEHFQRSYPPWPSSRHDFAPYILIAYSSPGLFQLLLSNGHFAKLRAGTNPLVYAAELRKTDHAMALLTYGVDINKLGLAIDDCRHTLPLDFAVDLGEAVLVNELLQRGCIVPSELISTAVCMPWCNIPVLVRLMQTDEFVDWAYEIGDEELYRSVFNSARPNAGDSRRADEDHVTMARILCQIGMDLSAESPFGAELIERAIHAAHISTLEFLLPQDHPAPSWFLLVASTGDTSETVSTVRFFLRKGVDVRAVSDGGGDTALHLAAKCPWEPRSLELTRMLTDAGCDPHALNLLGETPLTNAMRRGYPTVVELLLSRGAALPSNVLHLVLEHGRNVKMVRLLVLKGANIHALSELTGNTALHHAVIGREVQAGGDDKEHKESEILDLVKTFMKAGCSPIIRNFEGKTALEVAIDHQYPSVVEYFRPCNFPFPSNILHFALQQYWASAKIKQLVYEGANVHSITPRGDTILHQVLQLNDRGKYEDTEYLDLVKTFTSAGCDPTIYNSNSDTVLEVAIKSQRYSLPVVEHLLSCDIPLPSEILHLALQNGCDLQTIQLLIHKGADVRSATSPSGDTILHQVLRQNDLGTYEDTECLELVKTLTEAGCDPTIRNFGGETVLDVAIENWQCSSVVEHLLSLDIPLPSEILNFALRRRWRPEIIRLLARKGADVHSTALSSSDLDGNNLFHLSIAGYIETSSWDLVNTLIDAGCDPAACDSEGNSILDVAMDRGYISVVELLLSHDIPLGPLPVDILVFMLRHRSAPQTIESLVLRGADVHFTTFDGDTVIHLAIAGYHLEGMCWSLVKIFLDAGCNPTSRNSDGRTVLEAAIERGHVTVVELLLSSGIPLVLPPNILHVVLRRCQPGRMIEVLVQKGANVHWTSPTGDSVLHLAIAEYTEETCRVLVKLFIDAGCNLAACDSNGKTAPRAAVERGYTSVVRLLLSCNASFLPCFNILEIALRRRCTAEMIQLLVHEGAASGLVDLSRFDWDNQLQLIYVYYSDKKERRKVVEILSVARKACKVHPGPGDVSAAHVVKRPRLE